MRIGFSSDFCPHDKFERDLWEVASRCLRILLPPEPGYIVSIATLYTLLTNDNQGAVVYTSTGIAFATFTTVLLYHAFQKVQGLRCHHNQHTQYTPFYTNNTSPRTYTLKPESKPWHSGVQWQWWAWELAFSCLVQSVLWASTRGHYRKGTPLTLMVCENWELTKNTFTWIVNL